MAAGLGGGQVRWRALGSGVEGGMQAWAPAGALAELASAEKKKGNWGKVSGPMIDYSNFSDEALEARLTELRQDHADLDAAIQALSNTGVPDLIVIGRLKREETGAEGRDRPGRGLPQPRHHRLI